MRKKIFAVSLLAVILLFTAALTGCFCRHEWAAATCTAPETCTKCGKTQGEPLGHTWQAATCVEPETCAVCGAAEGKALGHTWQAATCTEPEICAVCGATEGEALGHSWTEATCTEPQKCSRCGETGQAALGHNWITGTSTTPTRCRTCGLMQPLAEPKNGAILIGTAQNSRNSSEITIKNSSSTATFVKLKNTSKKDTFGFYVRAGSTVTVNVPTGKFYVYFASGTNWYGTTYCFGDNTDYSKDDELIDFSRYTITYTLYPVTNGNFKETPINASEFR